MSGASQDFPTTTAHPDIPHYGPNWIKSVAFYCASTTGYFDGATLDVFDMGYQLVKKGLKIHYGGGNSGLMGALQMGAIKAVMEIEGCSDEEIRSFVTGVNLRKFIDTERTQGESHQYVTEMVVDDMHTRRTHFVMEGDVAISADGSTGTFNEIFESGVVADLGDKTFHSPILLLNRLVPELKCRYFDGLKMQIETNSLCGLGGEERNNQIYHFCDDNDAVFDKIDLLNSKPPILPNDLAPKRTPETVRPHWDILQNHGRITLKERNAFAPK